MTAVNGDPLPPLVEARALTRVYRRGRQEVVALRNLDMTIDPGEFVALKGRSGSGKTTLLNCLGGLDQPDAGRITVAGQDLSRLSEDALTAWRRARVGFIFQSFALMPTMSAQENVELQLRLGHTPPRLRRERAQSCLELVGLSRWASHRPYEMSGGQQQRVAVARAIAHRPQLILADEPTGELDSATGRDILALLKRICREQATTLVLASHDPLVDLYADRVIELRDGAIVERAPTTPLG
jgi:ABC-type lipoprotein export system ATPase subunit